MSCLPALWQLTNLSSQCYCHEGNKGGEARAEAVLGTQKMQSQQGAVLDCPGSWRSCPLDHCSCLVTLRRTCVWKGGTCEEQMSPKLSYKPSFGAIIWANYTHRRHVSTLQAWHSLLWSHNTCLTRLWQRDTLVKGTTSLQVPGCESQGWSCFRRNSVQKGAQSLFVEASARQWHYLCLFAYAGCKLSLGFVFLARAVGCDVHI